MSDQSLSPEDVQTIKQVVNKFESRSLKLPTISVESIVRMSPPTLLEQATSLLQRCVFLVRKGPPLDPMYEEAQLTVPGLHVLRQG